jgi:hypothetical protein
MIRLPQMDAYAACAAPKIPNLIAPLLFSGSGGQKAVIRRVIVEIILS